MTLVEVSASVAVVGVGVGLVSPMLQSARVASMRAAEVQNLKTFGVGHASYAMDHQDAIATFSWELEGPPEFGADGFPNWTSEFEDLNRNGMLHPSMFQLVDIVRRMTGDDGTVFGVATGFNAHRQHSHLALLDYLGLDPFEEFTVSPGDSRIIEAREIIQGAESLQEGVDEAKLLFPNTLQTGGNGRRVRPLFPFMTSYRLIPFAHSPDSDITVAPASQTHWHYDSTTPTARSRRSVSEVTFPGQKVLLHGLHDYASIPGQPIYFGFREAKAAQLFFDGSAGVNATADANFGINPRDGSYANSRYSWQSGDDPIDYAPPQGVTPLNESLEFPVTNGYYHWTAGGLKGIDFGAKPLDPFGRDLGDPYGD